MFWKSTILEGECGNRDCSLKVFEAIPDNPRPQTFFNSASNKREQFGKAVFFIRLMPQSEKTDVQESLLEFLRNNAEQKKHVIRKWRRYIVKSITFLFLLTL